MTAFPCRDCRKEYQRQGHVFQIFYYNAEAQEFSMIENDTHLQLAKFFMKCCNDVKKKLLLVCFGKPLATEKAKIADDRRGKMAEYAQFKLKLLKRVRQGKCT